MIVCETEHCDYNEDGFCCKEHIFLSKKGTCMSMQITCTSHWIDKKEREVNEKKST